MKEEVTKQLAQEALNLLQGTKAFVLDQAPDFMRQVLAWNMADAIAGIVCGVILLGASCFFIRVAAKGWGDEYDSNDKNELSAVGGSMVTTATAISGFTLTMLNISNVIKIHYAPKVFLLEYFAGLLK